MSKLRAVVIDPAVSSFGTGPLVVFVQDAGKARFVEVDLPGKKAEAEAVEASFRTLVDHHQLGEVQLVTDPPAAKTAEPSKE